MSDQTTNQVIEVIGFDLDNTLYHSTPEIQKRIRGEIYVNLSHKLGVSLKEATRLFEENYESDNPWGHSGTRTIQELARRYGKDLNGSDIVQSALEHSNILDLIDPNPKLVDMLGKLGKGRSLDLLTGSKYNIAVKKLEKIGIPVQIFEYILSAEERGSKSDGKLYTHWLELREIPSYKILYVGDNERQDILPAKEFGIRTCIVRNKSKEADYQINDILELESIL